MRLGYRRSFARGSHQQSTERYARVFDTARVQQSFEPREIVAADRRQRRQPHVGATVSRNDCQRDAKLAATLAQLFAAVAPVVESAKQPHQDRLRSLHRRIDEKVDRHRMAQRAEIDNAKTGSLRFRRVTESDGRHCQIGIGKGQNQNVRRRKPEILHYGSLVKLSRLADNNVHQAAPVSVRAIASRSRPFWPMTTRRPTRDLVRLPGAVELRVEALADALNKQAHRLAVARRQSP